MLALLVLLLPLGQAHARLDLRIRRNDCSLALEAVLQRRQSASRQRYKTDLVHIRVTSIPENENWIASKTAAGPYTYFTLDVMLRDLNSLYKDKELATAIVHDLQRLVNARVEAIDGLLKQSDFKSYRLAVPGRVSPEEQSALIAKIRSAVVDVMSGLADRNVIRRTDRLDGLVNVAAGPTADWADLLAKLSRTSGQATPTDAERARQISVERLTWYEDRFGRTSMTDGDAGLPHRKVFDLIKKFKNPAELASVLNGRFGDARVTPGDAGRFYELLDSVGQFASGLHPTERVVVSLENASEGGASLDFRGMNAANLHVTARAIARASNVDDMLRLAREGEEAVTAEFKAKMAALRALGPFLCSGDDCILRASLSRREKVALLRMINANPLLRDVRIAFIPPKIRERSERHILATHGEAIETTLRLILETRLPADVLDQTTFAVDMQTTRLNSGPVALMMASPSKLDARLIEVAFAEAVAKQNAALVSESSSNASYRAR